MRPAASRERMLTFHFREILFDCRAGIVIEEATDDIMDVESDEEFSGRRVA